MLGLAFLNKMIIWNYVKCFLFTFCIGFHPWEKSILSRGNLTKLCLKKSACSIVLKILKKAVVAVADDKKKSACSIMLKILKKAVVAVADDKKSIGSATREFNIPRKTLSDRINWKHPKNVGRSTYSNKAEESSLMLYIKYMASHSFPLNIKQIRACALAI